jgi:hypothetical protein
MENAKTISTSVVVNASKDKVWDTVYTRFGETYLFNPNLEGSHFTTGSSGDVGCERQCNLDSKTFIRERITNVNPLKGFSVDVVGGNMPMLKELRVHFDLKASGEHQTKVYINATFVAKPAFIGILMKLPFKIRLTNMLIGLKYFMETGHNVSKGTFSKVKKKYQALEINQAFA